MAAPLVSNMDHDIAVLAGLGPWQFQSYNFRWEHLIHARCMPSLQVFILTRPYPQKKVNSHAADFFTARHHHRSPVIAFQNFNSMCLPSLVRYIVPRTRWPSGCLRYDCRLTPLNATQ